MLEEHDRVVLTDDVANPGLKAEMSERLFTSIGTVKPLMWSF